MFPSCEWFHLGILTVSLLPSPDFWFLSFFLHCIPVCKPFPCTHKDKHPAFDFVWSLTSFCYFKAFDSMLTVKSLSGGPKSSLFRFSALKQYLHPVNVFIRFSFNTYGYLGVNFSCIVSATLCLPLCCCLKPLHSCNARQSSPSTPELPAVSCTHSCPGRYEMWPDTRTPVTTYFNN